MSDLSRSDRDGCLRIDLGAIVRETVASTHADLVTRPTGRAVREAIERRVASAGPAVSVSLIDFVRIRVLDFSCADEVVAKLLLRYLPPERPHEAFFLFRVVGDAHAHAVREVLARHRLAAVCTFGDGGFGLVGTVSHGEHAAWSVLERRQRILRRNSASVLGADGRAFLRRLCERRLASRDSLGGSASLTALARTLRTQDAPHSDWNTP